MEELDIKSGQKWVFNNSTRPPIVIKDYDKYSERVYWYNEDSPKMVFDFEIIYFINNFSKVADA